MDNHMGDRSPDIYSRLLRQRVVFLGNVLDDDRAGVAIAQLLHLEAEDAERDVSLYLNSPGGSSTAMFAILDTMDYIAPDVATYCVGQAASAAAVILACGAPGKRLVLPNSRVLLHQPHGGIEGQAADLEIHAREILRQRRRVQEILAARTGQDVERIARDTDRDLVLTAEEAVDYGVADRLINRRELSVVPPTA